MVGFSVKYLLQRSIFAIFSIGLFILPIGLGSVASAIVLIISLIWILQYFPAHKIHIELVAFQKVWIGIALCYFPLFGLSGFVWASFKYGFNTFSFVLSISIFWYLAVYESHKSLKYFVTIAIAGLNTGVIWALYQHHVLSVDRVTAYVGGGSNLVARVAILLAAFSMILLLINVNRWLKLFGYCLVNGAAALIVVYSGSRGSLLALPLLFVMPILFALPLKLMKSPLVWGGLIGLGLGATGLMFWLDPNGLVTSTLNRLQSVAAGEDMDSST